MSDERTHSNHCWKWHADCALWRAVEVCKERAARSARLAAGTQDSLGKRILRESEIEAQRCATDIRELLEEMEYGNPFR